MWGCRIASVLIPESSEVADLTYNSFVMAIFLGNITIDFFHFQPAPYVFLNMSFLQISNVIFLFYNALRESIINQVPYKQVCQLASGPPLQSWQGAPFPEARRRSAAREIWFVADSISAKDVPCGLSSRSHGSTLLSTNGMELVLVCL